MRVAVLGADGQLGQDVCVEFARNSDEVHRLTHAQAEICSLDHVAGVLREIKPELIVNTAAFHHVERCEQDPAQAFAVNAIGARNVAIIGDELNATLVHVSTDYVFDGRADQPYLESDTPAPLNVYGNTKLAGEHFVRAHSRRHFVLRTSALYGKNPCRAKGGLNFVDLMLKLSREREEIKVVESEKVTPTSTAELARQLVRLSRSNDYGLYHATAEGSCSWFEFAREIFALSGITVRLAVASPGDFPAKVRRPSYSVLENRRLKTAGLNVFRDWKHGLRDYLSGAQLLVPMN
jgi:dTDP-4-dehydrorhamnose reductase